jgi:integrase
VTVSCSTIRKTGPPLQPPRSACAGTREGFLSRADFEAILAHVSDADLADFIAWGFWTGMRKGEIAKLTWEAFDRETWALRLPARSAKTAKGRLLSLAGPLRTIIERRLNARRLDTPLVFHRTAKGKPGQPVKDFRLAWAAACKAVGITPGRKAGITFHDTRRTAVRNLIRSGVDPTVAKKISGHRTDSMFERYNITDEADLAEAVEDLEAYVSTLPTERKVAIMGGEPGPNPDPRASGAHSVSPRSKRIKDFSA